MLLLYVPMVKEHTSLFDSKFNAPSLKGYFAPVDSVKLTLGEWKDGSLQQKAESFLKHNLKIRPFAVRLNNQLHYDMLGEIRSSIVEGKDGYLFGARYVGAIQGRDYLGKDSIVSQVKKLKAVSAYLKEQNNTDLIIAIAFDKSWFHKDKLPARYDLTKTVSTNYETYLNTFEEEGINFIDFNKYFLSQKESTQHSLSTKSGIHWSTYGGTIASDSLLHFIGQLKNKEVNEMAKNKVVVTNDPRKKDEDIGQSINMWRTLPKDTFSYFEDYIQLDTSKYRPNVALIGDSFGWTIWGEDIPHKYWGNESMFMYYYNQAWFTDKSKAQGLWLNEENKMDFALQQDAIVLLYTPMNMNVLGSGFIDYMYEKLNEGVMELGH